ncbi:cupin domain-containing protein [Ruminococcaceae bacterium OttesenSCG-928-L11]|nr:cupin domain-containing protein [Ruminococcaceae bacterium OttesenSCG-928-L11]
MSEEMRQIASRIRELREIFDYSVEEMAEECDVTVEQYQEYEETGDNIPISVLYHIAQKFGVDMTVLLTGKSAKLDTYAICRRGKGKQINRYEGYKFESLAHRFVGNIMEPLLVTLNPGDAEAAMVTHKGQEFNLVLEGTVVVTYDGVEHTLSEGDAIYFDPTHPHGQKAVGDKKARFLTVIIE